MRLFFRVFFVFALFMSLALVADAKVKPKKLASVNQGVCAVAVDSANLPRVTYQGTDLHLYCARFDGKKWAPELVDAGSDCGWGNSIAVDGAGHTHISYGALRGLGPQTLVYAYNDGAWHITELGVAGSDTTLKLDSDDNPHILFSGTNTLQYASFDGATWSIEDTGLPSSPYPASFVLDRDNRPHIAYTVNSSGHFYATKETGVWKSTALGPEVGDSVVAVESNGTPHVATALLHTIRYYTFTGTNWTNELLWDPNLATNVAMDRVALAIDKWDRAHMLVSASVAGLIEVLAFNFDDGVGWNGVGVDSKNAGYYPSLALDTNGVSYTTYCTALKNNVAQAKWARIALPDLTGVWTNVLVNTTTMAGTVMVRNNGFEKSASSTVEFWLSDDAQLDAGDQLIYRVRLKGLKPGGVGPAFVAYTHTSSLVGKYMIAVIDPYLLTGDSNMLDNTVPTLISP